MATPDNAPYKLIQRQPPFNLRHVEDGKEYVETRCVVVGGERDEFRRFHRDVKVTGFRLQRAIPKVKGKAAAKAAKRARMKKLTAAA